MNGVEHEDSSDEEDEDMESNGGGRARNGNKPATVACVAVSGDGKWLASADVERKVCVFDLEALKVRLFSLFSTRPSLISFLTALHDSPDPLSRPLGALLPPLLPPRAHPPRRPPHERHLPLRPHLPPLPPLGSPPLFPPLQHDDGPPRTDPRRYFRTSRRVRLVLFHARQSPCRHLRPGRSGLGSELGVQD